jgi:FkbM family methyltransferase
MSPAVADRLKRAAIPLVRGYVRYAPLRAGKQALWERVVWPRLAWEWHEFTARTRFGARISGRTDEFLEQYLYYFGIWEPDISRAVAERLRPGDAFIDVGANIGYYALLASKLVGPSGQVVAIERSPDLFAALTAHLRLNGAVNVRGVQVAASDQPGSFSLVRGPSEFRGLTRVAAPGTTVESVDAQPLSALVSQEEFARVRLVKIDVEGAETAVVDGLIPLLASARPDLELLVELHGRSGEGVVRTLRARGFEALRLENDYTARACIERHAPRVLEPVAEPIDYECNVLFTPQR